MLAVGSSALVEAPWCSGRGGVPLLVRFRSAEELDVGEHVLEVLGNVCYPHRVLMTAMVDIVDRDSSFDYTAVTNFRSSNRCMRLVNSDHL